MASSPPTAHATATHSPPVTAAHSSTHSSTHPSTHSSAHPARAPLSTTASMTTFWSTPASPSRAELLELLAQRFVLLLEPVLDVVELRHLLRAQYQFVTVLEQEGHGRRKVPWSGAHRLGGRRTGGFGVGAGYEEKGQQEPCDSARHGAASVG